MLSSLLRPRKGRRRVDKSPFSSPFNSSPFNARDDTRNDNREESEEDEDEDGREERDMNGREQGEQDYNEDGDDGDGDGDEDEIDTPLLPIFSAAHLDKLPLYNITHSIRILIVQKCETTLSWDQLRSPQVSQFLVKPVQSQIRSNHFNRATLCALIANCLQFKKESEMHPGNAGVSQTRAMCAELLAMRLLKEYTTRELIDALSYDFDPLQGLSPSGTGTNTPGPHGANKPGPQGRSARISTVEIAIRATAKKFLAHALVVQQLEAIWAGSIVFHSAADNLHRKQPRLPIARGRGYGTIEEHSPTTMPADTVVSKKVTASQLRRPSEAAAMSTRRSVTLYDPRDASLFKLSRLRVPRYRQLFSTLSFAMMIGLFLAVLVDRSRDITTLEVIFWLWSAGYMLDEVVGFTEQGFGLYIISVWNAFDLGILILFFVYYVLRLYGVLMPDVSKRHVANMAYDVLASTAVLLFPRAFSVLDHYRYFSQLLIAFRMMALDLVAILILILISCSGFFVAFTLSFSDAETYGPNVAYALFQILMGFTPAAWEVWPTYNILGKTIMTMFLIICHFLIVTILITVLTNSFMAIVRNANEEHQFLFAVNTISMVKSDALFSYIAPTNIISWLVSPLRYVIPFRKFVKFNRTIIKVTHFPVLVSIFAYERVILSRIAYEPTDLVERRAHTSMKLPAFGINKNPDLFSPGQRLREPSVVSFRKDRALAEVFRRPFKGSTVRTTAQDMDGERRKSSNVVDHWMEEVGDEGGASPPMEQPRSVLERLETRRPRLGRSMTADRTKTMKRDYSTATRSMLSDPEDRGTFGRRPFRIEEETAPDASTERLPEETDADGDDELLTNDEADAATIGRSSQALDASAQTPGDTQDTENVPRLQSDAEDYFATPTATKSMNFPGPASLSHAARARLLDTLEIPPLNSSGRTGQAKRLSHDRQASSSTVLFQPGLDPNASSSASEQIPRRPSRPTTARQTNSGGTLTPAAAGSGAQLASGRRTPKQAPSRPRPIMPARAFQQTAPNLHHVNGFSFATPRRAQRQPSFNAIALDLASELGDNRYTENVDVGGISGMPASFSEQLFRERDLARERERRRQEEKDRDAQEEKGMLSRIMLARMNTLEEGFKDMLREVKEMRREGSRATSEVAGPSAGLKLKDRATRLGVDTSAVSSNAGAPNSGDPNSYIPVGVAGPKTPGLQRNGSERQRKSPRKLQRRNKGKEAEQSAGVTANTSPHSATSADAQGESSKRSSVVYPEPQTRRASLQGGSSKRSSVIYPEPETRRHSVVKIDDEAKSHDGPVEGDK